jgi:hypothetical protein
VDALSQVNKVNADGAPFWRARTLEELDPAEWEALCDGCARCCLNKLEDEETGAIHWTSVACRLLGVSRSAYYDWERGAPSDRALTDAWLTPARSPSSIDPSNVDIRRIYQRL